MTTANTSRAGFLILILSFVFYLKPLEIQCHFYKSISPEIKLKGCSYSLFGYDADGNLLSQIGAKGQTNSTYKILTIPSSEREKYHHITVNAEFVTAKDTLFGSAKVLMSKQRSSWFSRSEKRYLKIKCGNRKDKTIE